MRFIKLAIGISFFFTCAGISSARSQANKSITVLVKYKTLPGKDSLGLFEIKNLVAKVKNEPNYVNVIIHVDPADKSNILLYEQWSNEDYYKGDHQRTEYLQKFIRDSKSFLSGPPEISFWKTHIE